MKKSLLYTLLILIAVFFIINMIPVERTNPPVHSDLNAFSEAQNVFEKACYDCHSNETEWPFYAYVAPVSWFVTNDVNEGRRHLNFSYWGEMSRDDKIHAAREVWEEVEEGKMPMASYTWMHSDADLSADDKAVIKAWADSVNARFGRELKEPSEDNHDHEEDEEHS